MLRVDGRQVLLADVEPGQQRQGDRAPRLVGDEQPEDDEERKNMAIDVSRARRAGGRVVMHAGPLDVRPVPLRRRVVQGEGQPRGPQSNGKTISIRRRRAMLSAFLPAAATAM